MANLACEAELLDCGGTVSATNDAHAATVSDRLCDSNRASIHRWLFEHAHRSVPDNRLGSLDDFGIELGGLWSNIEPFHVIRNFASSNDLLVATRNVPEVVSAVRVDGQVQFAAALCDEPFCQFDFVWFDEASADLAPFCERERVSHPTPDEDCVTDTKQVLDHIDLIADLGAAKDRDERTLGAANRVAEVFDLFGDKAPKDEGDLFGSPANAKKTAVKKKPAAKKTGATTKVFLFDDKDDLFDDPLGNSSKP